MGEGQHTSKRFVYGEQAIDSSMTTALIVNLEGKPTSFREEAFNIPK